MVSLSASGRTCYCRRSYPSDTHSAALRDPVSSGLRAIIFDFNGVIADDEALHVCTFREALREDGIDLSKDDYYGTYLGMDERRCAIALLTSTTGTYDHPRLTRILDRKARLFKEHPAYEKPRLFPGVVEFVQLAGRRYTLAVASGGLRHQIQFALRTTPIEHDFSVIVCAEDMGAGKPDPAMYRTALERLNALQPGPPVILPSHCLVIEDSKAGIASGRRRGMKVADLVILRLEPQVLPALEGLFSRPG